jgi:hypothetical protein
MATRQRDTATLLDKDGLQPHLRSLYQLQPLPQGLLDLSQQLGMRLQKISAPPRNLGIARALNQHVKRLFRRRHDGP